MYTRVAYSLGLLLPGSYQFLLVNPGDDKRVATFAGMPIDLHSYKRK